jgi:hypothetical protein
MLEFFSTDEHVFSMGFSFEGFHLTHLVAMSVSRRSGTEPFLTASRRLSPQKLLPLGMTMSKPARAEATPACWAPQSDTTKP